MKKIYILILAIGALAALHANIAQPAQEPPYTGDIFSEGKTNPIRIENENLFLDFTPGYKASPTSYAEYTLLNPTPNTVGTRLVFLTHLAQDITVFIDEIKVPSTKFQLQTDSIPWVTEETKFLFKVYDAAGFSISFGPGENHVVKVAFYLPPGYNTIFTEMGPTYPQAAHALNMDKLSEGTAWYIYDLKAASTFQGGFGELNVTVKVKKGTELHPNIELSRQKEEADTEYYSGRFQGIPAPVIDIKTIKRSDFNSLGFTVGAGTGIPLNPVTAKFIVKGMMDICIDQHQISLGAEGDIFYPGLSLVLQYTLFPGGKTGRGYGWMYDVRAGGSVIFEVFPQYSLGFRVFAGFRAILLTVEIGYEITPITHDNQLRHALSIMVPVSF
ncbi:MAG: hypothetical protein JW969_11995 [Spirochaetales bacterium]|nr:hypothetical protein [Spirochaetales bacterium]